MAWWWADTRKLKSPSVIEATVVPGHCLDLANSIQLRSFISSVYQGVLKELTNDGSAPLTNEGEDRRLDCAVFNKACSLTLPPTDSIRAYFSTGEPLFPGTTLRDRDHVQICVRTLSNILYPKQIPARNL